MIVIALQQDEIAELQAQQAVPLLASRSNPSPKATSWVHLSYTVEDFQILEFNKKHILSERSTNTIRNFLAFSAENGPFTVAPEELHFVLPPAPLVALLLVRGAAGGHLPFLALCRHPFAVLPCCSPFAHKVRLAPDFPTPSTGQCRAS